MDEKTKCDRCGKDMEDEKNASTVGMMIQIYPNNTEKEFIDKQLGKYVGKSQFMFCYECLIDAMMGVK